MFVLDSVSCADSFPADGSSGGAQIIAQNGSNGGYAAVTANDVYVQLAFDPDGSGSLQWTPPVHVGPGNIILEKGTRGIRFRNYVAGQVAVVSAGLSEPSEPALQLTSAGVATSVAQTIITGTITAAGGITAGTGFTVAKGGAGVYTITFSPALSAVPVVAITINAAVAGFYNVTNQTVNGFTVNTANSAAALADIAFMFLAVPSK